MTNRIDGNALANSLTGYAQGKGMDKAGFRFAYAAKALLKRFYASSAGDGLVLKGGMMLALDPALEMGRRPTEDLDLHAYKGLRREDVADLCEEVAAMDVDDGVRVEFERERDLRFDAGEGSGVRRKVKAWIGGTRVDTKVDVGFGGREPTTRIIEAEGFATKTLSVPGVRVRAVTVEQSASEKVHAIHQHGDRNTRMRDYHDLWCMAVHGLVDPEAVAQEIVLTFEDRDTAIPQEPMPGLSPEFAAAKQADWVRFLNDTGRRGALPDDFSAVVLVCEDWVNGRLMRADEIKPVDSSYGIGW